VAGTPHVHVDQYRAGTPRSRATDDEFANAYRTSSHWDAPNRALETLLTQTGFAAGGVDQTHVGQLTLESPAATAKPKTVTKPATLPAWWAASGIMESISMTSSAPAAKPLMAAWRSPEALSAIP